MHKLFTGGLLVLLAASLAMPVAAGAKKKPPPPPPPAAETRTVTGTIVAYHTAPRGEVDGFVLDNGVEVKFPPHESDRVRSVAGTGDTIRATGDYKVTPRGDEHLQATQITNTASSASVTIERPTPPSGGPKPPKPGGGPPPPPPHGDPPPPPPPPPA